MSIFNNPEENYWRNFATKTVLILITVAIIVWFLPRNEGRMFRYDVGKPWMYGSVIAKFDFPIYKTDEAIKREQDSLMKQFQLKSKERSTARSTILLIDIYIKPSAGILCPYLAMTYFSITSFVNSSIAYLLERSPTK